MGARTNSDQCLSVGREAFSGKSGRGVAHKVYRRAKLCRGGSWMVAWRQHLASRVDRSCRSCSDNPSTCLFTLALVQVSTKQQEKYVFLSSSCRLQKQAPDGASGSSRLSNGPYQHTTCFSTKKVPTLSQMPWFVASFADCR